VEQVRRESPNGGFVKRDFHSGLWFEIGDDKARDKVGHAIRRAVDDMAKQQKKGDSKSKQAIKRRSKDDEEIITSDGESDGSETNQKEKIKRLPTGNKQRKNLENKLGKSISSNRSFQDRANSLVVPPSLYQSQGRPAATIQNRSHSMHQSMVVQPGSNLLTQNGPHAFDLFSRQTDRVGTEDMFSSSLMMNQVKDAGAALANQFSNAAGSQQAFSLMNQLNAAPASSFSNQLQMTHRFGQFGNTNELNQVGDNAAFLQASQLGTNAFFAGLSNQINNAMENNSRQQFSSFSQSGHDTAAALNSGLLAASTSAGTSSMHPMLGNDFVNESSAYFASPFGGAGPTGMARGDFGEPGNFSQNSGSHI
jgi:hypothetical protein